MVYNTVLDAIGNTPMIRLRNMTGPEDAEILVKYEGLNVGGSIKTRTAYNMICDAEARGLIQKDTVIVEPTSGTQGIGLALVGAGKGPGMYDVTAFIGKEECLKRIDYLLANVKPLE